MWTVEPIQGAIPALNSTHSPAITNTCSQLAPHTYNRYTAVRRAAHCNLVEIEFCSVGHGLAMAISGAIYWNLSCDAQRFAAAGSSCS